MHKGRVYRLNTFGVGEFFKKNYFLIAVCVLFIIGIILGVFLFDGNFKINSLSVKLIKDFINLRLTSSFGSIFISSFLQSLSQLFVIFLFGASLFGVVTTPVAIVLKGVIQGGIVSYLYSVYGFRGVAFNAIILIPASIIFIIIFIVAGRQSIKFSLKISSLTLSHTLPLNLSLDFKEYCVKFLIYSGVSVLSALLDAGVSSLLINSFSL